MRFTYDNSSDNIANPVQPPARALWGQRSAEEMGDFWVQLRAASAADRDRVDRGFRPKAVREDLVGYESLIRRTPDDVGLRDDAAVLYLELNEPQAAALHWRAVAALQPGVASTHFNLASALTLAGRIDDAVAELTEAVRLNPHYTRARNNLGRLLLARGQVDAALAQFGAAVRDEPRDAESHYNMGVAHRLAHDEAAAIADLRTASALAPSWAAAAMDLAWMLATAADASPSEVAEAIGHAERAVALTDRRDAAALDTLGVALAAAKRFKEADAAAADAIRVASDPAFAADIANRRALYTRGQRPTFR